MMMNNKTYDILKYIVTVFLPAAEALWLTLGKIWSFPYTIEIGASIAAVTVFLGACLGVSNANYNKMLDEYQDLGIDYSEEDYYKEHEEFYDTDEEEEAE